MQSLMDNTDQSATKTTPKPGTWAAMNYIQRSGVIGAVVLFAPAEFCDGKLGLFFGLLGWTSLLLGYVAGNLWRVRHALHFWWSLTFACVVHSILLPVFAYLVTQEKNIPGQGGKLYIYLAGGIVIAETLSLIFILRHVAMWLHMRKINALYADNLHR